FTGQGSAVGLLPYFMHVCPAELIPSLLFRFNFSVSQISRPVSFGQLSLGLSLPVTHLCLAHLHRYQRWPRVCPFCLCLFSCAPFPFIARLWFLSCHSARTKPSVDTSLL